MSFENSLVNACYLPFSNSLQRVLGAKYRYKQINIKNKNERTREGEKERKKDFDTITILKKIKKYKELTKERNNVHCRGKKERKKERNKEIKKERKILKQ